MAFREIRDVSCPVCGAGVGKPCMLRSGQPLSDIHCTDRISASAGVEPMTAPSVPYVPGSAAPVPEPPRASPPRDEAPPARVSSGIRDESSGAAPPPARPSPRRGGGPGKEDAADRLQPVIF